MTSVSRVFLVSCALVVLHWPEQAFAQFTDAHNYDLTPVGVNQLKTVYAWVHGNASIDPSLAIAGATLDINQGTIDYMHYFGLFHRLTWVEATLPVARLNGSVSGTAIRGSTFGAGDSAYAMGMLVKGGPALKSTEFESYTPTTIVGVSVAVTAPTGLYDPDKILNLGSDRWSFKPEVALSHPFGPEHKWQLDTYVNTYFYTNNTDYQGREILRQEPLIGCEGHISYSFTDRLWISADTRYSFRGGTVVDGVDQDDPQQNVIVGSELQMSLSSRHTLLVEVAKAVAHRNSPNVVGVAVKYAYAWGH